MKIALVNYRYYVSVGPERYMFNIKDVLEQHGHTVFPFSIKSSKNIESSFENYFFIDVIDEIWFSEQADRVRGKVRTCLKNCWMVGPASPVMKKYITKVAPWVLKAKGKSLLGKEVDCKCFPHFDVEQDPRQGDLRDGE